MTSFNGVNGVIECYFHRKSSFVIKSKQELTRYSISIEFHVNIGFNELWKRLIEKWGPYWSEHNKLPLRLNGEEQHHVREEKFDCMLWNLLTTQMIFSIVAGIQLNIYRNRKHSHDNMTNVYVTDNKFTHFSCHRIISAPSTSKEIIFHFSTSSDDFLANFLKLFFMQSAVSHSSTLNIVSNSIDNSSRVHKKSVSTWLMMMKSTPPRIKLAFAGRRNKKLKFFQIKVS